MSSRRRWGVTAGCTALVLAVGAGSTPAGADERPQRALQAVAVQLGTDGSVTQLTSSLISRDDTGTTTEAQALNPAEHAGELPVQITTSWRHDGEVGTDLADLEGVSGRVEINVTVQNTTLHPERFQYDAGGVAREGYELVATPMTVVASAQLPAGSGASLVRPQPGATEPGTTNGVIDTDGDEATVQWASLLAPPRLSAGTTFTLVQDAEDFQLPAINLAVQPGLATDTSIARLVGTSFDGSAALVGSENNTIGLISSVNATLAEVAESLETVQRTLSVNAGEVGSAATAALASTAASVDAAAAAVLADLQALDGSIGSTVQSTNGRATSALQVSIQGVRDYFGTPADLEADPDVPVTGCGTPAAEEEPATTLLGQLGTVSRQLGQLSTASGDCVEQLRGALRASIGDAESCATPADPDAAVPLVCQLQGAGQQLGTVATELTEQATDVLAATGDVQVAELRTALGTLVQSVQGLQDDNIGAVEAVLDNGGLSDMRRVLRLLGDGLDDVRDAQEDVGTAKVAAALADIKTTADARLAEFDETTGMLAQLEALADSVCAFPGTDADTIAKRDALRRMIDGTTCTLPLPVAGDTGDEDFPEPLAERLQAELEAWQEVAGFTATATTELTEVTSALDGLDGRVGELDTLIENSVGADPLRPAVRALLEDLKAVYRQSGPTTDPCDADVDPSDPPLNVLAARFAAVECNQQGLGTKLQALLNSAAEDVRDAGDEDVAGAADAAEAAGATADGSLAGLSATLLEQLGGAADRQVEQGRAVVEAQQARLAAVQAAAELELDASAQEAVGRLADQVAAANQQQAAAAAALQAQLQKVLVDLGSAENGRGLLGVMQNSAGQTGVRTEQVQETSQTAASYQGVRVAELADAQLERQQLVRSMQAAQRFEPFAVDLPRGSTSATVFAFRIGGES